MSPVYKFSAPRKFTAGPTVYTSMLAGNTKYDNWQEVGPAGNAGLFRSETTNMYCFDFATDGTYVLFGNLSGNAGTGNNAGGGFCNSTRFVQNGAYKQSDGSPMTQIWYADISTKGNGASFGSLTVGVYAAQGFCSTTRGISYAGYLNANIDYVTIATTGNGTTFGSARQPDYIAGGCSSPTRGTSWGSQYGGQGPYIDYVTIATTGNYTNFGQMSMASNSVACGASSTRGVGAGIVYSGGVSTQTNEYITFASTGNSASFGTLTTKRVGTQGVAKATTNFVVFGGSLTSGYTASVEKWAIASGGSATSWGTLASALAIYSASGGTTSNCHGGV